MSLETVEQAHAAGPPSGVMYYDLGARKDQYVITQEDSLVLGYLCDTEGAPRCGAAWAIIQRFAWLALTERKRSFLTLAALARAYSPVTRKAYARHVLWESLTYAHVTRAIVLGEIQSPVPGAVHWRADDIQAKAWRAIGRPEVHANVPLPLQKLDGARAQNVFFAVKSGAYDSRELNVICGPR